MEHQGQVGGSGGSALGVRRAQPGTPPGVLRGVFLLGVVVVQSRLQRRAQRGH